MILESDFAVIENIPELPYAMEEAMNKLRINVSFLGDSAKKIMIISSEPNEGKSFVSMQLWQQFVKMGESAILIDADLRKSVMVEDYKIKRKDGKEIKGTSHLLSRESAIEDYLIRFDNCAILPNTDNVVNPSILLEGDRFTQLLDYAQENFRYVLVDSPPLALVSDGEKIGSLCDGAILVVRAGVTPRNLISNSINELERAGCPLYGIALNRVMGTSGGYYSKRYYGRYGRYGKYSKYSNEYYTESK